MASAFLHKHILRHAQSAAAHKPQEEAARFRANHEQPWSLPVGHLAQTVAQAMDTPTGAACPVPAEKTSSSHHTLRHSVSIQLAHPPAGTASPSPSTAGCSRFPSARRPSSELRAEAARASSVVCRAPQQTLGAHQLQAVGLAVMTPHSSAWLECLSMFHRAAALAKAVWADTAEDESPAQQLQSRDAQRLAASHHTVLPSTQQRQILARESKRTRAAVSTSKAPHQ